jgi:1,4-alpha-glucan branching enzyme
MSHSSLSDFDLYLFAEGSHQRIYDKLGAHVELEGGVAGTRFAVWAPNAIGVSVVGDFNRWDGRENPMHPRASSGVWELFIPDVGRGAAYKYEIRSRDRGMILKADPYGFAMQPRPQNCSIVTTLDGYPWGDLKWVEARQRNDASRSPFNAYEVHLGSWKRPWDQRQPPFLTWHEAVDLLIPYVIDMGYTHIELMGIAEHPLDESWGYQVVGYYAVTSRYGSALDFMYFIDSCHRAGIGVILDWVPAHFPRDDHGLSSFDGTALYEHFDSRLGEHMDWGTKIFNYGRHEVRNFLVANALFWADRFHIDGLRVDAVASMLYLDYSRKPGDWLPNRYGGRENLEAIDFLRQMNAAVRREFPGVLTIAEESTSFAGVTADLRHGGLGFSFKWNMGWMNDTLKYFAADPIYRRFEHQLITFSFMYAWSERFVLPISHDEVVHGKRSLLAKMPGDEWQQRANLRLLLAYMMAHPGKKVTFMGCEFGQWREWRDYDQLDWGLLADWRHQSLQGFARELNHLYRNTPAFYDGDCQHEGFQWIDLHNSNDSVWAFARRTTHQAGAAYLCVFNATPVPRNGYRLGTPQAGEYRKVMDSDDSRYGGSGYNSQSAVTATAHGCQGFEFSLQLNLPPLGAMYFTLSN